MIETSAANMNSTTLGGVNQIYQHCMGNLTTIFVCKLLYKELYISQYY